MLHAGACFQCLAGHAMGCHAIGKLPEKPDNLTSNTLFFMLWYFLFHRVNFSNPSKIDFYEISEKVALRIVTDKSLARYCKNTDIIDGPTLWDMIGLQKINPHFGSPIGSIHALSFFFQFFNNLCIFCQSITHNIKEIFGFQCFFLPSGKPGSTVRY